MAGMLTDRLIAWREAALDRLLGVQPGEVLNPGRVRRAAYRVGGHRWSCEDIEHGVLRGNRGHPSLPGPQFGPSDPRRAFVISPPDVRVHCALNCATRACPPIAAYAPDRVETQLDLAAGGFVAADAVLDAARGELRVSRIFKWFARDFGGPAGVIAFVERYLPPGGGREWLAAHPADVRLVYRPYDWRSNALGGPLS